MESNETEKWPGAYDRYECSDSGCDWKTITDDLPYDSCPFCSSDIEKTAEDVDPEMYV